MRQFKTRFQCYQCGKYSSSRESLRCHMRSHNKTVHEPSSCSYDSSPNCRFVPETSNNDMLQMDIDTRQSSASEVNGMRGQETSMNGETLESSESLDDHENIYCTLCNESFSSLAMLKVHYVNLHLEKKRKKNHQNPKERERQQESPPKEKRPESPKQQRRESKNAEKQQKESPTEKIQEKDKRQPPREAFKCPICDKTCYLLRGLKVHMYRIHEQKKDIDPTNKEPSSTQVNGSSITYPAMSSCRYCVRTCKSEGALQQHMFYKHKDHYVCKKTLLQVKRRSPKIPESLLLGNNYPSSSQSLPLSSNKTLSTMMVPMSSSSPAGQTVVVNASNNQPKINVIVSRELIISKAWAAKALRALRDPIRQKIRPQPTDTGKLPTTITMTSWKEFSSPSRYAATVAAVGSASSVTTNTSNNTVTDICVRNSEGTQFNPLLIDEIVYCPICRQVFLGVPYLILHLQKEHQNPKASTSKVVDIGQHHHHT